MEKILYHQIKKIIGYEYECRTTLNNFIKKRNYTNEKFICQKARSIVLNTDPQKIHIMEIIKTRSMDGIIDIDQRNNIIALALFKNMLLIPEKIKDNVIYLNVNNSKDIPWRNYINNGYFSYYTASILDNEFDENVKAFEVNIKDANMSIIKSLTESGFLYNNYGNLVYKKNRNIALPQKILNQTNYNKLIYACGILSSMNGILFVMLCKELINSYIFTNNNIIISTVEYIYDFFEDDDNNLLIDVVVEKNGNIELNTEFTFLDESGMQLLDLKRDIIDLSILNFYEFHLLYTKINSVIDLIVDNYSSGMNINNNTIHRNITILVNLIDKKNCCMYFKIGRSNYMEQAHYTCVGINKIDGQCEIVEFDSFSGSVRKDTQLCKIIEEFVKYTNSYDMINDLCGNIHAKIKHKITTICNALNPIYENFTGLFSEIKSLLVVISNDYIYNTPNYEIFSKYITIDVFNDIQKISHDKYILFEKENIRKHFKTYLKEQFDEIFENFINKNKIVFGGNDEYKKKYMKYKYKYMQLKKLN